MTRCGSPSGSSSTACASSGPSRTEATRQPISRVTVGSSAAASRSTSSTSGLRGLLARLGRDVTRRRSRARRRSRKRVISWPKRPVQKTTSWACSTGSGAAARSRSAMPQRRRCSIVRTLVVLARGRSGSSDGARLDDEHLDAAAAELDRGGQPAGAAAGDQHRDAVGHVGHRISCRGASSVRDDEATRAARGSPVAAGPVRLPSSIRGGGHLVVARCH